MKKRELYKIEGEKLIRLRQTCPKCGDGVFLAEHKDRMSCGTCGYTEFKGGGKKEHVVPPQKVEETPVEPEKLEEAPPTPATVEEPPVESTGQPPAEAKEETKEAEPPVEKPAEASKKPAEGEESEESETTSDEKP
jgi:small subunit ribosomal protein S27Ae